MRVSEEQLGGWSGKSSATEQDKQDRTERMVRDAIAAHPAFNDCHLAVYAKGSYANETNVRVDSDVDIAVECKEVYYYDSPIPSAGPPSNPYNGIWTPTRFRTELETALRSKFGAQVDTSGSTAIAVNSSSARMDADVVPCFSYRYYSNSSSYRGGTKIFKRNLASIINYPAQHLEEGHSKDRAASYRYKAAVRILKRIENQLVASGTCSPTPSFLVESLVWNCPNNCLLGKNSWTDIIRALLASMWEYLSVDEPIAEYARWTEANGIKFLVHPAQPWTREDAQEFVLQAWAYMGYPT